MKTVERKVNAKLAAKMRRAGRLYAKAMAHARAAAEERHNPKPRKHAA